MKSFINYVAEEKQDLGTMIRDALKKAGYKVPKDISIRKNRGGYETSFTITVKSFTIDLDDVKKITNRFKDVDYDEVTGEILAGGNTYIHVQYDANLENREFERIQKFLEEVKQKCIDANGKFVKIGKGLEVSIPNDQTEFQLKTNRFYYVYKLNGKQQNENPSFDYTPLWMILLKAGF